MNPHEQLATRLSLHATLRYPQHQRRKTVQSLLDNGFPYSRNLDMHRSCVNALTFSSLDGRFLASGGDDLDIHLWDLSQDEVRKPCWTLNGHVANIFVLKFSAHDRYLYSGGVDRRVFKYDVSRIGGTTDQPPSTVFYDHNDNIRGIATHRVQDDIFLTVSEDGRIVHHDERATPSASPRAQDTIQLETEVNGVEFHPTTDHLFVTCDSKGAVCLRDMRMAFGPRAQRSQLGVVQTYNTKLARGSTLANPEASSVTFNRQGTHLAVTMLNWSPTIYPLNDPNPVAVCSAPNRPDGTPVPASERTYGNCCTIKHGSFGGPGLDEDTLYAAGSDDFRVYIWSIPPKRALEANQRIFSPDADDTTTVAYTSDLTSPRCLPTPLETPLARLGGHSSIVNTVLLHPRRLLAASAGVESRVVLHGAVESVSGEMRQTSGDERAVNEFWEYDGDPRGWTVEEQDDWESEERRTLRLFDGIVRQERSADVFVLRRVVSPPEDDEEETEEEEEEEEAEEDDDGGGMDEDEE
ncbi:WD40 repeat-like protein [Mycena kentingensis (nom. inval.)]|nr:WD40 repeat-like protein [Mycena kentingensis (nom. inval.)]